MSTQSLFKISISAIFFIMTMAPSLGFGVGIESVQREFLLRPLGSQDKAIPTPNKSSSERISAGDFYYWQGKAMPLYRSSDEFTVRFKKGLTAQSRNEIVNNLAFPGEIVREGGMQGSGFSVVKLKKAGQKDDVDKALNLLRSRPDVEFAFPVFTSQETGTKMFLTDQITLKLKAGNQIEKVISAHVSFDLVVAQQLWGTEDQYILNLQDPKSINPIEVANALFRSGLVEWAEPNFVQDYKFNFTPNDPLFTAQWHLKNIGQLGQPPGADVRAPEAWDIQQGSPSITIAVIDDGVEIAHQDLQANIFTNPGEVAGNGVDDDGNGFIDDVNGWDFFNNDNNPNPSLIDDDHGTAVAGVAAAVGNNSIGVSGACLRCKILPVRIGFGSVPDSVYANAIRYGATFADVLNNSWGGGAPSSVIQSAIQYATTSGRGGRGSVVLFSSGNDASGYLLAGGPVPAGTHRFIWTYSKDISFSEGNDTAWLAWALFPGGQLVNFEGGVLPSGWTTAGSQPWSVINDPTHADEGLCYSKAAKAGTLNDNQESILQTIRTVTAGDALSFVWVSSEYFYDGLRLQVDLNNDGSIDLATGLISGVPFVNTQVSYPAAHPESIAVGASSNLDCRSYYSQYGTQLDFVASSNGGPRNLGITTTDRTGSNGYDPTSYTGSFGGTSSACPLAAGVAGLILSECPSLTQHAVRALMRNTADKVGLSPYVGGRNNRYGFGRINAFA